MSYTMRIEERLQALGLQVDGRAPERLACYYELLADWNERINLTADAAFDTALDRHFMDSLAPLAHVGLFPADASLIDVGTGAGFPGLPLAIARPDLQVTLLDSLKKRLTFLSEVVEKCALTNVRLVHARAEDAGQNVALREQFDIAVARAVAPLPVLCELLLPFVRVGGRMLCYKGPAAEGELSAAQIARELLGGGEMQVSPVNIPFQPEWRHCVIQSEKRQKTVRQYPRKAGTPSKKPLGDFEEIRP